MSYSTLPKQSSEFDVTAASLRKLYFEEGPDSFEELPVEAAFFWRKVAKLQKMSGCSQEDYVIIQKQFFEEHEIDPSSIEAVESLITEPSYKRARNFASGHLTAESTGDYTVTDEEAEEARRIYEHYRKEYYPRDMRTINPRSDMWKKIVLVSYKSHESLEGFIRANFAYTSSKKLKVPTPQIIASKDGLNRSIEMNRTILEGPR